MDNKTFNIGHLMSITTDFLLAADGMVAVYEILNYMMSDSPQTVALCRAADECKPYLYEQHPWLRAVDVEIEKWLCEHTDNLTRSAQVTTFVDAMAEKFGAEHVVRPIHKEDHEVLSPLEDAIRLGFKGKIIEIKTGDEPSPYGNIDWKAGEN